MASDYTEASIKTLSSTEHIRLRPGMYIGRLGNGAHAEDGIYVLLKETIDNSIDEFTMGHGKKIEIELERTQRAGARLRPRHPARQAPRVRLGHQHRRQVRQRDLQEGRGPQRRRPEGGQRALRRVPGPGRARGRDEGRRVRAGQAEEGPPRSPRPTSATARSIEFTPDEALFGEDFKFRTEFVEDMLWNYAFLNRGLTLTLNGKPLQVRARPEGPPDEEPERRAALPDHPPRGRGHRDRAHPRHPLRRGVLLLRQRPAHHHGRHAPRRLPRGARRDRCATSSRRTSTPPTSASRSSPPSSVRVHGAGLRVADQDQARLDRHRPRAARRSRNSSASSCSRRSTPTCTRTRETADALLKRRSRRASTSARSSPASAASPASGRRRPRSTTASCATAACTSATRTSAPRRARSSSSRATPPPARSPPAATCRPRPSSPSRASRSTPTA